MLRTALIVILACGAVCGCRLRKAYVPPPEPVRTTPYAVGCYYFPGWNRRTAWDALDEFPERRPVLGYYREGDPEVMDWQIKWASEHGISFWAFDWYWNGGQMLGHALHDGYLNSRYRGQVKFCLLFANHMPMGTDEPKAFREIVDFWIANYFKRPEYFTIDGRPLVIIFSEDWLRKALGQENIKAAFDDARAKARAAGLKGIYFVGCAAPDPGMVKRMKQAGYDALTGYNYPRAGMTDPNSLAGSYDSMIDGYASIYDGFAKLGEMDYIPVADPGWDSRPWHGDKALVRTDRTPAKFRKMLQNAKSCADAHPLASGERVVLIEAWNEFGEGEAIEPHKQWGFAHLQAVSEVFAPDARPRPPVKPEDLGLGPYDLPARYDTKWVFRHQRDMDGWNQMGLAEMHVGPDGLTARTVTNDPAFLGPATRVDAAKLRKVVIEMKLDRGDMAQLFWRTRTQAECEANSVRFAVQPDGQWHMYEIDVAASPGWAGEIRSIRLDPNSVAGATVCVKSLEIR